MGFEATMGSIAQINKKNMIVMDDIFALFNDVLKDTMRFSGKNSFSEMPINDHHELLVRLKNMSKIIESVYSDQQDIIEEAKDRSKLEQYQKQLSEITAELENVSNQFESLSTLKQELVQTKAELEQKKIDSLNEEAEIKKLENRIAELNDPFFEKKHEQYLALKQEADQRINRHNEEKQRLEQLTEAAENTKQKLTVIRNDCQRLQNLKEQDEKSFSQAEITLAELEKWFESIDEQTKARQQQLEIYRTKEKIFIDAWNCMLKETYTARKIDQLEEIDQFFKDQSEGIEVQLTEAEVMLQKLLEIIKGETK